MDSQQQSPTKPEKLRKPGTKLNGEPRRKTGPKKRITPKFLRDVERLAAKGLNQRQIAVILRINHCTLSAWKTKKGELTEQYSQALERGMAQGVQARLDKIEKHSKKSWQAAAWQLERIYPDQFARRDNVRIGNPDGTAIESAPTVIAPTVVFVQPEKVPQPVIEIAATNGHSNGHLNGNGRGLPEGNGKH